MIKKLKNKNLVNALVLIMVATILMTPLATYAAFTQLAKINGDGVRLRRTPVDGTILELMYRDELIWIDCDTYYPENAAWIYVKRIKTGTTGWMEDSYYVHDWDGQ